jgi:hypothetical protein
LTLAHQIACTEATSSLRTLPLDAGRPMARWHGCPRPSDRCDYCLQRLQRGSSSFCILFCWATSCSIGRATGVSVPHTASNMLFIQRRRGPRSVDWVSRPRASTPAWRRDLRDSRTAKIPRPLQTIPRPTLSRHSRLLHNKKTPSVRAECAWLRCGSVAPKWCPLCRPLRRSQLFGRVMPGRCCPFRQSNPRAARGRRSGPTGPCTLSPQRRHPTQGHLVSVV